LKYVYSDTEANGGKLIIRNIAFLHVQAANLEEAFAILGNYQVSKGGAKTEVTNVHVQIDRTDMISWPGTNSFKGMFNIVDAQVYESFEMKNVYIDVNNDGASNGINYSGSGTITSRDRALFATDSIDIGLSKETRQESKRFENVITVSKTTPCSYRRVYNYANPNIDPNAWSRYLYFIYAENTIGKDGKIYPGYTSGGDNTTLKTSAHNPVADDPENGSYIYYGVYQYAKASEVEADKLTKLIDTGFWKYDESGALIWATKLVGAESDDGNFDIDWIPGLN
jgi:hypothetical protein